MFLGTGKGQDFQAAATAHRAGAPVRLQSLLGSAFCLGGSACLVGWGVRAHTHVVREKGKFFFFIDLHTTATTTPLALASVGFDVAATVPGKSAGWYLEDSLVHASPCLFHHIGD